VSAKELKTRQPLDAHFNGISGTFEGISPYTQAVGRVQLAHEEFAANLFDLFQLKEPTIAMTLYPGGWRIRTHLKETRCW
jgi:hypothetical protein